MPDVDRAAHFLAANARVLDRRRFERLFQDGSATPVRDAVAAYRNPDGGFGHGIEPDGRTPGSQPAAVAVALEILDEADAWDAELVDAACDWLEASAPEQGGAASVAPSIEGWPHAPWWQPEPGLPPSLITTGQIAGTLHARGTEHPWLDAATEWLWEELEAPTGLGPYALLGAFRFLDHAPDRARAEAARDRLAEPLARIVTLDPEAEGEVHGPLTFAPEPDSIARALFDAAVIDAHLDHLAAAQQDDGGWTFNWLAWSPVAAAEWRGFVTVGSLRVLRANQLLPQTGQGSVPRA
jgi:hypothetical protein